MEFASTFRGADRYGLGDMHARASGFLAAVAEPVRLTELFNGMLRDPVLTEQAEQFRLFTKLVLAEDAESGVRLRLHVFGDEVVEEAHNHRASFTARVLAGSYTHVIYGTADELWRRERSMPFEPRFVQEQTAGTSYSLHHDFVHSTLARPGTVSLVLQAPRCRSEFRIVDLNTLEVRRRMGAAAASAPQEPGERKLGPADLVEVRERLAVTGLLAADRSLTEVGH